MTLTEPLLSATTNANNTNTDRTQNKMKVEWPEAPVPLLVPPEWSSSSGEPETCFFQYDADNNLLKLVTTNSRDDNEEEETVVVDVLDPDDIVGVHVEINMNSTDDDGTTARATTTTTSNNDNAGRPSNAPPTDTPMDTQAKAVLTIYAYPRHDPNNNSASTLPSFLARFCGKNNGPMVHPKPNPNYQRPEDWRTLGRRYAFHRRLTVVASEDVGALNALVKAIRQAAQITNNRGRALVMINPKSGPNCNAEDIYETNVQIVLDQAGIEHDVCVTTHPQHAQERMMDSNKDILDYESIICLGGDGIVHEVLQGIRARSDAEHVLRHVKIGIVGCGTSNGMAKSIAETSHQETSYLDNAFLIAKGRTKATDLSVYQTTSNQYWSFLTFSWAMLADVDIDSEVIRFLGSARFDIWGLWCTIKLKPYKAKLSYLPGKQYTVASMPDLNVPLPENAGWVTEEDDFLLLWAAHVSHAAENTHNSPMSRLDDGIFQLLVVRYKKTSRLAMAKILLGLETGSHAEVPQAEFIECSAYRLEPITKGSYNDLDGEVIEAGPIQGKVLPGAMKVFCL